MARDKDKTDKRSEHKADIRSRFGSPLQWLGAAAVGLTSGALTFINLTRTKFHEDGIFREGFESLYIVRKNQLTGASNKRIQNTVKEWDKEFGKNPAFKKFAEARDTLNDTIKEAGGKDDAAVSKAAERYNSAVGKFFRKCGNALEKFYGGKRGKKFHQDTENYIKGNHKIKAINDKLLDEYAEKVFGIHSRGFKGHTIGAWQRFRTFGTYSSRNILIKAGAAIGAAAGVTMMVFNQLNTRNKLNEIDKTTSDSNKKIDTLLERPEPKSDAPVSSKEKEDDDDLPSNKVHGSKYDAPMHDTPSELTEGAAR